jgi:hypothetical protein
MSRIADDNAPTVEVARPNAKTIAAIEGVAFQPGIPRRYTNAVSLAPADSSKQ